MKLKISIIAALLAVVFPFSVQAEEVKSQNSKAQDLNVSCESGAECDTFGINFLEEEEKVAQSRRTRTRRTRRRGIDNKFYAGGNLGLFVPFFEATDDDNADVGFTFGGLFGYRFTENISAEIELYDSLGGTEIDDLGYNLFGASANGVYRYYFNPSNSRSLYIFGGGGLGVGVLSATGDVADDAEDAGFDTSQTGFLLQAKLGVGYPISDRIDIFGQSRFTNVFLDEDEEEGFDGEDANGISFDVGATFKF
ncbi:MAG: outer membrane beta-barrel protein [Cyanobacteria bacterium P01_C01_bin.72]